MRFTHAYAAAPVCSTYRAAVLTGQHPARIGILDYLRPNSANALSTQHITLPEVLKNAGYAKGMRFLPTEAIAHIDHDHIVRAKHPIIDQTRKYFVLQDAED